MNGQENPRLFIVWYLLASWLIGICSKSGPTHVPCPPQALLRSSGTLAAQNQQLNPTEQEYIENRRKKIVALAYRNYLENVERSLRASIGSQLPSDPGLKASLPDYVKDILDSTDLDKLPRTALAASGGGYRATLYSAGILNALDGRNQTSANIGTGGLLQAFDYLAGLSGGSWLLTALAQANFPMMSDLALGYAEGGPGNGKSAFGGLLTQYDLFDVRQYRNLLVCTLSTYELFHQPARNKGSVEQEKEENQSYVANVIEKMSEKLKTGFFVTMADFWSLVLSYHIVNGTTEENFFDTSLPHGLDITFSGIQQVLSFQRYEQPFPIVTVLPISPGQDQKQVQPGALVPISNTAYEYTPLETGSWDDNLAYFVSTEYLGTRLLQGEPQSADGCVQGFDQASYLAAISSDIFPTSNTSETFFFGQSSISTIVSLINTTFSRQQPGISIDTASVPNPFLGMGTEAYLDRNSTELRLLDGGLDGAVTPYLPLLVPVRQLDLIIGSDADGTSEPNYPTGSSLQATFARAQLFSGSYKGFPKIPDDPREYAELREHPTFFGCEDTTSPLIVWLPNSAPLDGSSSVTNTSINKIQYERSEVLEFLSVSSEIGYRGFPSKEQVESGNYRDPLWSACLACAVVDRSRERQNISREGLCSNCFQRYCWGFRH